MTKKYKIKKDDTVVVIAGKDKGSKGKVLSILKEKERAVVQGVAMVKRHMKARSQQEPGGIIEKEGSISLSNLQLFCKTCKKGVRVQMKTLEDNSKVRTCKICGESI